jgi:probable rRNA maturation factor
MIRIHVFNTHPAYYIRTSVFKELARRVFYGEGTRTAACNVVFIDDRRMIMLNTTYLKHRSTTDVLSFSLHNHNDDDAIEGEVYVNVDQARRQSRQHRVTYKNELGRLVVHGILHLLGYRDKTKRQQIRMSLRQEEYLLLLH